MHVGDVQLVGRRESLPVGLASTHHEDLSFFARMVRGNQFIGLLQRAGDLDSIRSVRPGKDRDHDIVPFRQWLASDRQEGHVAHHDRAARGFLPEIFHVFGNMPEQGIALSDRPVVGYRHDNALFHIHFQHIHWVRRPPVP